MSPPVCFTTTTWSTFVPRTFFSASSTLAFSGIFFPPRTPSSAVMTTRDEQSSIRPFNASGENPPNTTEWTAPMRAQASIAIAVSGIIGM